MLDLLETPRLRRSSLNADCKSSAFFTGVSLVMAVSSVSRSVPGRGCITYLRSGSIC